MAFFRLCGLRKIIGFPKLTEFRKQERSDWPNLVEYECVRLAGTLSELGIIDLTVASAWDLLLNEPEKYAGKRIVEGLGNLSFIAINMGGKAVEKDWGAERWSDLLEILAKSHYCYGLLIVGGAEDFERARSITRKWPNLVVNACGKLAPRESAAALQNAALFIGHDSGPLHLAAASQVRCIGLFGNFNIPRQWHPYGEHHHIIHRMEGISAINVGEVALAVSKLLPVTELSDVDAEKNPLSRAIHTN